MLKVAVTDYTFADLSVEKEILEPLGCQVVGHQKFQGEEALKELVKDADYVIAQFAPVNANVINAMQKNQIIVRYGIGYDNVDCKAAAAKNIPVCNVPDFCVDEVADHAVAMILALARKIVPNNVVASGQWKLAVPLDQMFVMKKLTVGLVAYGKIGKEVALRLKPFKCNILVFDPVVDAAVIKKDGFTPATLDEIYAQSDLVSLHCPSNEHTKQMINAKSIAKMKKGVMFVNTSRGTLVNTDDLVAALKSGHISAAALDVTDPEPIPSDSPLLKMNNVIINSHIASASVAAVLNLRKSVANTVIAAIKKEKLPNVVNGVKK